jgi:hypothetical protein
MKKLMLVFVTVILNLSLFSCTPEHIVDNTSKPQACCDDEGNLPPPPPPPEEGTGG